MLTLTFAQVNQLHLYLQMLVDGAEFDETEPPPALRCFDLLVDDDGAVRISVAKAPEVDDNGVIRFPTTTGNTNATTSGRGD